MATCPCGLKPTYKDCCGKFISGKALPATPEELMRSRYTAYTRGEMDYIVSTMQPPASDHFDVEDSKSWSERVKWLGLEVISAETQGSRGMVEFRAHFSEKENDQPQFLHERSEFKCLDGRWFYTNAQFPQTPVRVTRVGRNDPCLCGSGKKSKKCCA